MCMKKKEDFKFMYSFFTNDYVFKPKNSFSMTLYYSEKPIQMTLV